MHHNAHKNGGAGFGSPVCFYEVLKETKRDILRKLTGEKNIALLDDEIFVLNQNKKIPKERKNDVIYFVNNEKKLVFNMKPSLK